MEKSTPEFVWALTLTDIVPRESAIAKMISDDHKFIIKKIVATWKDEAGTIHVIPPCGHCRQAMLETDESNIDTTEVILDIDKSVKLRELFPYHDWWQKIG